MFPRRHAGPLALIAIAAVAACARPARAAAPSADTTHSATLSITSGSIAAYWRTRAERTNYQYTSDYDETMRYCRQLEGGSRWIKLTSYGESGQGRELPLIILSKDRAFTPEAARATGKPIVLIQNGIHSGEIEGKDASLALIRDIAVLRTRPELIDSVIVLILPIFSVDAHERSGPYNRINQNGPEEMGWRATPIGLNLNRDYLKVESPEMRAMIGKVFTQWWPHLLVDNHTTDGADYRHDLTYAFNRGAATEPALDGWLSEAFEVRVLGRCRELGHLPAPYLTFVKGDDPLSGIQSGSSSARYSTGYGPIQCRPAILIETHMLKSYALRVKATYDVMLALLEEINARPQSLTRAVQATEEATIRRGQAASAGDRRVALTTRPADTPTTFAYKGVVTTREMSDITGGMVPHYTSAPWDTIVPWYRDDVAARTVIQPAGYVIPQEWAKCRDKLDIHGVRYRRFARAWSDSAEFTRIERWRTEIAGREGHHPTAVDSVSTLRRLARARPGDLWVPLDQRSAQVAVRLFEAQSGEGLTYWNGFDTVLEQKEYAEDYVMEPLARKMLASNPALAKEFRAKLDSDTTFAKSPAQRVNFFFLRSKWADPDWRVIPPARALRSPPEDVLAP